MSKKLLNPLIAVEPEGFNAIDEKEFWELVTMYVDSGATETVIAQQMLSMMEIKKVLKVGEVLNMKWRTVLRYQI